MPIQRSWNDPNTGASFGQAVHVVGKVDVDTARQSAIVNVVTYVGLSEYSAGLQPIDRQRYEVTGNPYQNRFDRPVFERAQDWLASHADFSGGVIV